MTRRPSDSLRECPACALDAPAGTPECPFCGYEFPTARTGTRPSAWLMIALMAGAGSAVAYLLGWLG